MLIFRCDLNLEVVDKNRISQVKVATIKNIVGKRLHVKYYDAEPGDNGMYVSCFNGLLFGLFIV